MVVFLDIFSAKTVVSAKTVSAKPVVDCITHLLLGAEVPGEVIVRRTPVPAVLATTSTVGTRPVSPSARRNA